MRYLHTMVRVADLDKSLAFYCDLLGLKEIRRIENKMGRFTLVFLAAPEDAERATASQAPMVELTYNWDPEDYKGGRNFGHLAYPSWRDNLEAVSTAKYHYDGCEFDVFPVFTNGRFDSIILEPYDRPAPCYLQIRKELLARYGAPAPAESRDDGTRLEWKTRSTFIWYIGDSKFLHIAFEQARGSPHHVISDPAPTIEYRTPGKH